MQKGFNTDIVIKGKTYHVQTEDWGQENPFLVSRVFCNGAVLKTIKTSYQEALKTGPLNVALRSQHSRILRELDEGRV